jgi:hypothetical protein
MSEYRTYTDKVSKFLKEKSCSSLVDYLISAKLIRNNEMDDADVVVSYWIMREDAPSHMRKLIPTFNEYVKTIERCGILIDRILPEFNLDENLYNQLIEPIKGS